MKGRKARPFPVNEGARCEGNGLRVTLVTAAIQASLRAIRVQRVASVREGSADVGAVQAELPAPPVFEKAQQRFPDGSKGQQIPRNRGL